MKGAVASKKSQYELALYAAWHLAALSRTKKLPRLQTLLNRTKKKRKMTWQEMYAVAKSVTAMLNLKGTKDGK